MFGVRELVGLAPEVSAEHSLDVRGRVEVEGRWFEVTTLPRTHGEEAPVLMALESNVAPEDQLPLTLLARLAEGVRSELSLSDVSGDATSDSDVSHTI